MTMEYQIYQQIRDGKKELIAETNIYMIAAAALETQAKLIREAKFNFTVELTIYCKHGELRNEII